MKKSLGFLLIALLLTAPTRARGQDDCAIRHTECKAKYLKAVAESRADLPSSTCEAELRVCLGGAPDQNTAVAPPDMPLLAQETAAAVEPMDEGELLTALILAAGPIEPSGSLITPTELRQDQHEERIKLRRKQRDDRQNLNEDRQDARQDFREKRRDARQEFREERRNDRRNLRDILR